MNLTPTVEKEIQAEANDAQTSLVTIRDMRIETTEDSAFFADCLRDAKSKWKELDGKRKEITDPINLALKRVNDLFRPALSHLKTLEDTIKNKLALAEVESRQRAQAALYAAAEAAQRSDSVAMTVAIQQHDVAVETPKADGVSYRTIWDYEIIDEALIPREYMTPNLTAIKAMATGLKDRAEMPGVKFFARTSVSSRS